MSVTATKSKSSRSATLASMAKPGNGDATSAPVVLPDVDSFDWDALPSLEVATYTRNAPSKDFEACTPSRVKAYVREAFEASEEAGERVYKTLRCASPEQALVFTKSAREYARFLGRTFRGGPNGKVPSQVRFAVTVKEVRPRKAKEETAK